MKITLDNFYPVHGTKKLTGFTHMYLDSKEKFKTISVLCRNWKREKSLKSISLSLFPQFLLPQPWFGTTSFLPWRIAVISFQLVRVLLIKLPFCQHHSLDISFLKSATASPSLSFCLHSCFAFSIFSIVLSGNFFYYESAILD